MKIVQIYKTVYKLVFSQIFQKNLHLYLSVCNCKCFVNAANKTQKDDIENIMLVIWFEFVCNKSGNLLNLDLRNAKILFLTCTF